MKQSFELKSNEKREIFRSIQDTLNNVDSETKKHNKTAILGLLHEFQEKLSCMDARGLEILEFAKIIDLFADIENVITYLVEGNEAFNDE